MKKTALITGASGGIGKELAIIHAEQGGDLVIVARNQEKLEALKTQLEEAHSVQVTVIAKDLIAPNAARDVYDEVANAGIDIDYLINNAGFGGQGKFHERDLEEYISMIQLNIVTLTSLSRLFLPDFVERNSGRILNVSSTASLLPGPLQAVYFATKAYVTSFSNALAGELHDTDVTVTALMPGPTETEFVSTAGVDDTKLFKTLATARSVAEDGYEAMLAGKLDVITGVTLGQRISLSAIPLCPKRPLLDHIRKMQEVKK